MFWRRLSQLISRTRDAEGERDLERALSAPAVAPSDSEAGQLADLARRLERLGTSVPGIDERRVWLRVRAGMLAQPQQRTPRGFAGVAALFALTPRPVLAGALAVVLLAVASMSSLLLQPRESASAAFLDEVQQMLQASGEAADRGAITDEESSALQERALGLLERASRPQVISGLQATEAELARGRLEQARSALAAVVSEHPGNTRALAALAAISGLLDPPQTIDAARGSTPDATATATVVATAAAVEVTSTPVATPTVAGNQNPGTSQGRGPEATRTPEPEDRGRNATPTATPSPAGALVSMAQVACARVYDLGSLSECTAKASAASAACAATRGANGCERAIEVAVGTAQQRVQRVGEDCQRLPSNKAREACSEATNKSRSSSDRGDENKGRSGGGQRNESDSRGRRD
jgi:hypothetical protein